MTLALARVYTIELTGHASQFSAFLFNIDHAAEVHDFMDFKN